MTPAPSWPEPCCLPSLPWRTLLRDAGHALLGADLPNVGARSSGVSEGIDGHHHRQAKAASGCRGRLRLSHLPDSPEIRLVQVSFCNAAVALEGTDVAVATQHAGVRAMPTIAALDFIQEPGTRIRTGSPPVMTQSASEKAGELAAIDAVAAVGNVGKGAAVDDKGLFSSV